MFGIGFTEILVIAIIALLIFGPDKLPEFTKKAGRFSGQLKKTSDQVRKEIFNAMHSPAEEIKKEFSAAKRDLLSVRNNIETEAKEISDSIDTQAISSNLTVSNPPAITDKNKDSGTT